MTEAEFLALFKKYEEEEPQGDDLVPVHIAVVMLKVTNSVWKGRTDKLLLAVVDLWTQLKDAGIEPK